MGHYDEIGRGLYKCDHRRPIPCGQDTHDDRQEGCRQMQLLHLQQTLNQDNELTATGYETTERLKQRGLCFEPKHSAYAAKEN